MTAEFPVLASLAFLPHIFLSNVNLHPNIFSHLWSLPLSNSSLTSQMAGNSIAYCSFWDSAWWTRYTRTADVSNPFQSSQFSTCCHV
jgi:hypothetical protein